MQKIFFIVAVLSLCSLPLRNQIIMRTLVVMSGSIVRKCVLVLKRNTILMFVARGVLIGIKMGFLVKMFVVDNKKPC